MHKSEAKKETQRKSIRLSGLYLERWDLDYWILLLVRCINPQLAHVAK